MRCSSRCSSKRGRRTNLFSVDGRMSSASRKRMWLETSAATCVESSPENLRRLVISSAMRVPTSAWLLKWMRSPGPLGGEKVGGLPTSWSKAPQARVDVAPRMELWRLFNSLHSRDFRQHRPEQAGLIQKLETAPRRTLGEYAGDLIANAFGGDQADLRGVGGDGGESGRLDRVAEARSEAHSAEHAQLV